MKRLITALIAAALLLAGCFPIVPPPPGHWHGGHHGEYHEYRR